MSLCLLASACGTRKSPPEQIFGDVVVSDAGKIPAARDLNDNGDREPGPGPAPSETPAPTLVNILNVQMTVNRAAILSEEFFYGADLQYSSQYDAEYDLYNQSIAIGHIPAKFRIAVNSAGSELQLVTDNKHKHPSDVNTPEQVLTRFRILSQDSTTLTVSGADSRLLLGQIFKGSSVDTEGNLFASDGQPARDLWIRSIDQEAIHENYILQETSIVDENGNIAEFMESIFPRSKLAAGADFKPIKLESEAASEEDQGLAERFSLLGGESIFLKEGTNPNEEKKKAKFAQKYDISGSKTIDWYVTPNMPDEFYDIVKQGVEGWNRYFKDFQGINREVVLFKGRLPVGVKLGDPRYNIINWDTREEAGAAYESQASDPFTGKQSHSLIYLPIAWVNIGKSYWTNAQYGDIPTATQRRPKFSRISCSRDLFAEASIAHSGRLNRMDVETFGKELLRGTLFHEVGHALGLGHNFKGSLAYDMTAAPADRIFSSSIMDYNNFELEKQAYTSMTSSDGPKLEYDRQALSALYNKMTDVPETDTVMPVCNDEQADAEEGGVDPLCMRYDVEKDPTQGVVTAFKRVNEDRIAGDVTLADSVRNLPAISLPAADLAAADDEAKFKKLVTRFRASIKGSLTYYYGVGRQGGRSGIRRTVNNNLKALKKFADDVLPETLDEKAMRERAFKGARDAISLDKLPQHLDAALDTALVVAQVKLLTTPYLQGLEAADRDDVFAKLQIESKKVLIDYTTAETGLPGLRASVLANMSRSKDVPYFFGAIGEVSLDVEKAFVGLLSDASKGKMNGGSLSNRTAAERAAALESLLSFKGRRTATAALAAVKAQLEEESAAATSSEQRELFEELLAMFEPAADEEA